MSEANNTWRVEIDSVEYDIELQHTLGDKHTIKVNGQIVKQGRKWVGANEHVIEVAGRQAVILIDSRYAGFVYESTLHLDGRYVEPLQR